MSYSLNTTIINSPEKQKPDNAVILCHGYGGDGKDISILANYWKNYLPKTVFMVVDKKIELETKYLKDYPDWEFLSKDELNRRTIQIFEDLKKAKGICTKDQKVIKVPNTNVFSIVAPLLVSRGISRIVTEDKLIAL